MDQYGLINIGVLCILLLRFSFVLAGDDISGYYWRDYNGHVPYDAVPGGTENGQTTYIGQALFREIIVPAKIVPKEGLAHFEWGFNVYSANETVKILCTSHPEYIHWIRSSTHEFGKITDKHFIVAGYEPGGTLYIGRQKNEANDVILGKLLFNKDGAVLHSSYHGASIMHWDFEALYFDPAVSEAPPVKDTKKETKCKCKDTVVKLNLFC